MQPVEKKLHDRLFSSKSSEKRLGVSFILHKNGDKYNPGKHVFINYRTALTWGALLEQLRLQIGKYFPAIRCVVTPRNGSKVISLEQIEDRKRYIAVPRGEVTKLIDYQKVDEIQRSPKKVRTSSELFEQYWQNHQTRLRGQGGHLSTTYKKNTKVILVYRNGDVYTPSIRVQLRPIQSMNFELIMRAVEDCVILPDGKSVRNHKVSILHKELFSPDLRKVLDKELKRCHQINKPLITNLFYKCLFMRMFSKSRRYKEPFSPDWKNVLGKEPKSCD